MKITFDAKINRKTVKVLCRLTAVITLGNMSHRLGPNTAPSLGGHLHHTIRARPVSLQACPLLCGDPSPVLGGRPAQKAASES